MTKIYISEANFFGMKIETGKKCSNKTVLALLIDILKYR